MWRETRRSCIGRYEQGQGTMKFVFERFNKAS
jgi:hypothetical protein